MIWVRDGQLNLIARPVEDWRWMIELVLVTPWLVVDSTMDLARGMTFWAE